VPLLGARRTDEEVRVAVDALAILGYNCLDYTRNSALWLVTMLWKCCRFGIAFVVENLVGDGLNDMRTSGPSAFREPICDIGYVRKAILQPKGTVIT
jgi:hypothetical protein